MHVFYDRNQQPFLENETGSTESENTIHSAWNVLNADFMLLGLSFFEKLSFHEALNLVYKTHLGD